MYPGSADTGDVGGESMASCKACWCRGPPCVCSEEDLWGENKSGAWNGPKADLWDPSMPWNHIVHSYCNENNFQWHKSSQRAERHKDAAQK